MLSLLIPSMIKSLVTISSIVLCLSLLSVFFVDLLFITVDLLFITYNSVALLCSAIFFLGDNTVDLPHLPSISGLLATVVCSPGCLLQTHGVTCPLFIVSSMLRIQINKYPLLSYCCLLLCCFAFKLWVAMLAIGSCLPSNCLYGNCSCLLLFHYDHCGFPMIKLPSWQFFMLAFKLPSTCGLFMLATIMYSIWFMAIYVLLLPLWVVIYCSCVELWLWPCFVELLCWF